jgi:hypothetical protein
MRGLGGGKKREAETVPADTLAELRRLLSDGHELLRRIPEENVELYREQGHRVRRLQQIVNEAEDRIGRDA